MKTLLMIAASLLISATSFAEEDLPLMKGPTNEGFKEMKPNGMKDVRENPAHTNVVTDCKLPSGKMVKKGDREFQKCIAHANSQKKKPLKPDEEY